MMLDLPKPGRGASSMRMASSRDVFPPIRAAMAVANAEEEPSPPFHLPKKTVLDPETLSKTEKKKRRKKKKTTVDEPKLKETEVPPQAPPARIVSPTDQQLSELSPLTPGTTIPPGYDFYFPDIRVITASEQIKLDPRVDKAPHGTLGVKGQHIVAAIRDLLNLANELGNHPPQAGDAAPRRNILKRMRGIFDQTDFDAIDVAKARRKLATAHAKCASYKRLSPHAIRANGKTNKTWVRILSREVIPRLVQREASATALRDTLFEGDYRRGFVVWWLRQIEYLVSMELEFAPRAEAEPCLSNVVAASSHSEDVQVAVV